MEPTEKKPLSNAVVAAADKDYDSFKNNIEQVAEPRMLSAVKQALQNFRGALFKKE